ncbi:hypothetical protein ACFXJ8_26280 [Nonomuraea sp. NPDC059194]|uniref:hypothetical protein n=1 Tax=Nonomuraea sp. NPDC059194 TaxID=3346764 RepID=UPI0036CB85EA
MSRHVIPNAPDSPSNRVTTVGWDAPLTTFFAMAFDRTPDPIDDEYEDEIEVFWIGAMPGELPTVEALEAALKVHGVELTPWIASVLAQDKEGEGDRSGNVGRRLVDAMLAEQKGGQS